MLRVFQYTPNAILDFYGCPHKIFDKFSVIMISLSLHGSCISHILVDCVPILNHFASFNSLRFLQQTYTIQIS